MFSNGRNLREHKFARLDLPTLQITSLFHGPAERNFLSWWESCQKDLVVGADQAKIFIRDLPTGSEKQVYRFASAPGNRLYPILSHDTKNVAFVEPNTKGRTLKVVPSDGGAAKDLTTASFPAELLWLAAWSPDDRYVYFGRRADKDSSAELFRMPVSSGAEERVGLKLKDMGNINIAPDGKHIAFGIGPGLGQPEIWALRNFLPPR